MPKNILVIEDQPLYCQSLVKLLRSCVNNIPLFTCNSIEEAINILDGKKNAADKTEWIIILDPLLPRVSGLLAIYEILKFNLDAKILVLSSMDDPLQVSAFIGAGAKSFISKSASPDLVIEFFNRFFKNKIALPEWISRDGKCNIDQLPDVQLTPRQLEVLLLICQGKTNRFIADSLNIIEATAKAHVSAIFRKLNVLNRTQAVLAAQKLGLKINTASKN